MSEHETSDVYISSSDSNTSSAEDPESNEDESSTKSTPSHRVGTSESLHEDETQAAVLQTARKNGQGGGDEVPDSRLSGKLSIAAYTRLLASDSDWEASSTNKSEELSASFVGASFWTAAEKHAFFRVLAVKGQDDLPALAQQVANKAELEVRAYLLYLQNASSKALLPKSSTAATDLVPAAFETSAACEAILDQAATDHALRIYKRDIKAEKTRFEDSWLIDETTTAAFSGASEASTQEQDANSNDPSDQASLLRPEAFLQLSENLFMNGPPDTEANWRTLSSSDPASPTPAIFHSAFLDFEKMAEDLTRRTVHATILQATSRIRAKDDGTQTLQITKVDVEKACAILGLERKWKVFWAGVARRFRLDVYSNSKKFCADGRQGTKNGVKLTYEEVEAELGFPCETAAPSSQGGCERAGGEGQQPMDLESESSDAADEADSDADGVVKETEDESSSDGDEDEDEIADDHLERSDQKASQAEERRVLHSLYPQSTPPSETQSAELKPLKRRHPDQGPQWRKRLKYSAEWETMISPGSGNGTEAHAA